MWEAIFILVLPTQLLLALLVPCDAAVTRSHLVGALELLNHGLNL